MTAPGPRSLGRGIVVVAGNPAPDPWSSATTITIDESTLRSPAPIVERLHAAWAARTRVVVELAVDASTFREPVGFDGEPWRLGPGFEPWYDRLHFLVWANNYDGRGGQPVWWWARKAVRCGATEHGPADVMLPDGSPAWIDGGPRAPSAVDVDEVIVHAETVEAGRLTRVPPAIAPIAELAADQLAAVGHGAGPARVIAPAGSGKTRVLTGRLRHLLADRAYESEAVLAVAYNREAQREMAARTSDLGARIRTLNSWGYTLLTAHRGRRPQVLEEREVRRVVEGLVPRPVRRVNTDPYARYLEGLSLIRLGLRDPDDVEAEFGDVPGLATAFGPFRDHLGRLGAIDFDEQIYATLEALLADGSFRRTAQREHRHLLVDEFQDLTPAHMLLVRLLSCPAYDVFGVGDDDQTINRHVGADPRFLVDYASYFPAATSHALEVNYRCPVAVTEAASTLLGYNHVRVAKVIRPGPGVSTAAGDLTVNLHASDAGARAVVDLVEGWSASGSAPGATAVLARVQSLLLAPHVALTAAGVPVDSILDPSVLDRLGVRAALAYLRIAGSPTAIDPADLVEVQRRPSRGLPRWADKWLIRCTSIGDVRRAADRLDDARVAGKLGDLAVDLDVLAERARAGATARTLLTAVRDDIGLGSAMSLLDSTGAAAASHLDDLEALLQVSDLHPEPGGFAEWLHAAFTDARAADGVTLSTVHRVKGREWPNVIVFGATSSIMPHRLSDDIEEERRVFHVAITRAVSRVVVLADASRPSPFLGELDGRAPHQPAAVEGGGDRTRTAAGGRGGGGGRARPPVSLDEAGPVAAALRAWRSERARADAVPAYVVLSDKHLLAVAERRPATRRELAGCPGIGPARLETYGDDILAVLASLGF